MQLMSNQQIKISLVALALLTIMVFAATLPAVNALTPSSVYERYSQKTDTTPGGQHVCGDTLCSPGTWAKMKQALFVAQHDPTKCSQLKEWMYCGQPIMNMPKSPTK
jgi:hypothetical protein